MYYVLFKKYLRIQHIYGLQEMFLYKLDKMKSSSSTLDSHTCLTELSYKGTREVSTATYHHKHSNS